MTGARAGTSPNANDLDGRTTVRSPAIDAAVHARSAADLRLCLRPQRRLRIDRYAPGDRRTLRRLADRGLPCRGQRRRRRRCVAHGLDRARCLRRPDRSPPVRGDRRGHEQSRRGRARRRPGHREDCSRGSKSPRWPRSRGRRTLPSPPPTALDRDFQVELIDRQWPACSSDGHRGDAAPGGSPAGADRLHAVPWHRRGDVAARSRLHRGLGDGAGLTELDADGRRAPGDAARTPPGHRMVLNALAGPCRPCDGPNQLGSVPAIGDPLPGQPGLIIGDLRRSS